MQLIVKVGGFWIFQNLRNKKWENSGHSPKFLIRVTISKLQKTGKARIIIGYSAAPCVLSGMLIKSAFCRQQSEKQKRECPGDYLCAVYAFKSYFKRNFDRSEMESLSDADAYRAIVNNSNFI